MLGKRKVFLGGFRSGGKKEEGGGRMKWEWRGQVRGVTILLGITIIGMIIV